MTEHTSFARPVIVERLSAVLSAMRKPRRVRLPGAKRIERERRQIERESGKTVASITLAPGGARSFTLAEKAEEPVDTPEQLQRLI
jgi:hypothetical protein